MNKVTNTQVHEWVLKLYDACESTITAAERKEQHKYATLIQNPKDKIFLSKLLDESSQIRDNKKLAGRIKVLIDRYGVPEFFSSSDSMLLNMYKWVGYKFDFVAVPIFKKRLRLDTAGVIINEARPLLTNHLAIRKKEHIGQNVNLLGEVVLGNAEADHRYKHYLEALKEPDINYISIKISGIYAQLHPLNFRKSREDLINLISTIYQQAIDYPCVDEKGEKHPKFVNLDMEEYKDAHLTLDIFKSVLSLPQFKDYTAGIVIQAYLPDAWHLQSELLKFAKERVANGGAPLKMRLVKGANLQMESVVSSLRGWPNPVRSSKVEVDANYLHLLDRALEPENAAAVHVGVASHNLFSISYAYLLSQQNGVSEYVTFEMLEGMANQLWRAMAKLGNQVILYTPVVKEENFLNAVSYLVRRLDENTGPENFLSYSFNLKPGTEQWNFLQGQFDEAYDTKDSLEAVPTRTQDRSQPYAHRPLSNVFENEPDTDFDLMPNKLWAEEIVNKWKKTPDYKAEVIPLQIGVDEIITDRRQIYVDRCQQEQEVRVYEMSLADTGHVDKILSIADSDPKGWRRTSLAERHAILNRAANLMGERRGDMIGCMCAVTGKTITEGDVEVSEAIDFMRFYPITMKQFEDLKDLNIQPKGTILVISPWNFPLAIPVGGVAAALSGGNTVILKPATVAAPIAWEFAKVFWDAGVPREVLQVVICEGRAPLEKLTTSPVIRHIILTGGTDTAQRIATTNPRTPLSAETGGKNAMIVTSSGDRDKAIINAVASAFGNAGQKCSACSLLLLEKEVFEDASFRKKLIDATLSLQAGSVWDMGSIVGPMITNRNDKLQQAIEKLESGAEWLVAPRFLDKQQYMMAPTVKWGVEPSHFTFKTELFAPLLAVGRIDSMEEGIGFINDLEYGLTSGLQSLDESEQALWTRTLEAGNLYINRGITGAIVNRQPFGGMKLSAFGGGVKAGGVNYVSCFVEFSDRRAVVATPASAAANYAKVFKSEFAKPRDVNNLYGEQNLFRYLPLRSCALRVFEGDNPDQIRLVAMAAITCGTPLIISIDTKSPLLERVSELGCEVRTEPLKKFLASMGNFDRIRTISTKLPDELFKRAAELNKYIATAPALHEGRVELLHYLKEQSITYEYHRYGSIAEVPTI